MIPVHTIAIDTDLVLRKIIPLDANDIFSTIDSERSYLGQWLPFVEANTDFSYTTNLINTIINADDEKNADVFTMRYCDEFAGVVGFKIPDLGNKKIEIGYWLSERFQHKGIVTRCVKVLCERTFNEKDINRIQIKCAVGNSKSSAIPKRLGFTFEGLERDGELLSSGEFVDLEIYSKLKSESF